MKKLSIFLALIVGFTAFAVAAEHDQKQMKDQTVEEINQLEEGACVKLEGMLSEHEEENIFLYQDDTGEIKVEITQEVMGDLEFNPEQKYEIKGEVVVDEEQDTVHVKATEIEEAKAEDELPEEAQEGRRKAEEKRQEAEQKRREAEDQQDQEEDFLF